VNTAFSEYVLYEPILRVLVSQGFWVRCEYPCPGIPRKSRGDKKKIDFEASKDACRIAVEVKWHRTRHLKISDDCQKLAAFQQAYPDSYSFLCIFGKLSDIAKISLPTRQFEEPGGLIHAGFIRTRYGCRIFELRGKRTIRIFRTVSHPTHCPKCGAQIPE